MALLNFLYNHSKPSLSSNNYITCLTLLISFYFVEKASFEGNDKTKKVKKRREAKKLAKESSNPTHIQDPASETS